jgi:SulP family sulfate permease
MRSGSRIEHLPPDFFHRVSPTRRARGSAARAIAICLATIAIVQLWPRVTARVPDRSSALARDHCARPRVRMAGRDDRRPVRRGFRRRCRRSGCPRSTGSRLPKLFSPAVSIALLAAIESLLSAVVADGQIGGRHRSNAELLGQGIANLASPLFGGFPPRARSRAPLPTSAPAGARRSRGWCTRSCCS